MVLLKKLHHQRLIFPLQQRIVQLFHFFEYKNDPKNAVLYFKCNYFFLDPPILKNMHIFKHNILDNNTHRVCHFKRVFLKSWGVLLVIINFTFSARVYTMKK